MGIRVIVADDHVLFREGLVRLLDGVDDMDVVGAACDIASALQLVEEHGPDVVLTDIRMPPSGTDEGIRLAIELRERLPPVGVLVLSNYREPQYALALLESGVDGRGYLLKERVRDVAELTDAVRRVAGGGSVIDPTVVGDLVRSHRDRRSTLSALTPRETEVLSEMAQGKSNAAIATCLTLTERAVEKHANVIFSKLGLAGERDINRRVRAVLLYLEDAR